MMIGNSEKLISLIGARGKLRFGVVHRVAYVGHDLGLVPAEFELHRNAGIAFGGGARDGFQAVEVGQFGLHRLDQQGFAVFRGNAGEGDRNEQRGDFDVGLALFGKAGIGKTARDERKQDERDDHPGARGGPVDDPDHLASPR